MGWGADEGFVSLPVTRAGIHQHGWIEIPDIRRKFDGHGSHCNV